MEARPRMYVCTPSYGGWSKMDENTALEATVKALQDEIKALKYKVRALEAKVKPKPVKVDGRMVRCSWFAAPMNAGIKCAWLGRADYYPTHLAEKHGGKEYKPPKVGLYVKED